jgi:hypothetical protein
MNIDFTPFAIVWVVFAVVIAGLLMYRRLVREHEEDTLFLSNPREEARQMVIAHRLDVIDRWGKLLTIVAAVYSVLLVGAYAYHVWIMWNARVLN